MMEKIVLTSAAGDRGKRLDAYIAENADGITRSAAQRLIEGGNVRVDGKPAEKSYKLRGGEKTEIALPEPEEPETAAQDIPLDVVYEDADVIVVNKPSGMVVHPAPGHADGTLVNALLAHCKGSLSGIGGERRPGIVHRIDRDTSGLIIAAKNDRAHLALAAQLKDHTLARTYEAIVVGNMKDDSGTVDAPIGRCPTDRKKMCVTEKNSRNAVTHWEILERFRGYCHVRCRLETGRTHQIRVHMAHIGHPILGDTVYGAKKPVPGLNGQCLHASGLRFVHPATGKIVELSCPLPPEFRRELERLRSEAGNARGELVFRAADAGDLPALNALYRAAVAKMRADGLDQWDDEYPFALLPQDIARGELYIGLLDGAPASAITAAAEPEEEYAGAPWREPEARAAILHRLCVAPEKQGLGIGTETVAYAERLCRSAGFEYARLDASAKNAVSIALYEKLGYRRVGALTRFGMEFCFMEKKL
jgi:23S rRNA pseudouridine1911/1915/1917 synthase